ncbi:hypothetical protein IEQ34_014696 [Dendrobium chrysotoxum]|uniref:Peptidase A1 domain-containing protein n=1 Tax=Dendrobium chrysotoxum TaxID=161865 RepID=A0AAV7GM60_DENCH|nr:hypothetical protein IEQ34_014696 [Dendrobium chrysotoxum]
MVSSIPSLAISLLILSTTGFLPLSVYGTGGFSVDLIHRDSPRSPLSDSSSTPSSRLKAAAERSFSRANYFRNAMQQNNPSFFASSPSASDNIYSGITENSSEYLMSFYVGSPAKEVLAIADTGSDLIWIQCKPCKECYPQTTPLFDPQASSTYKVISCKADSCLTQSRESCSHESECEYNYAYGDGSFVDGFLSTETLSFDSTGGRRVQVPSTVFGCTHHSNGTFSDGSGIVGLGGGQLSLIRQLGSSIQSKFSYCLPPLSQSSATSRLNFGSSAVVSGSSSITTPLIPGNPDTFYFLHLDQISVDGQGSVLVNPSMQASVNAHQGNIIIDSGTPLTFLDNETLQSVANKVASSVSFPKVTDPNGIFSLCFDVSGSGDDAKLPDITFHFSGGAPVVLHEDSTFVEVAKNTVCLALLSSDMDGIGVNIFGNIAQQNFHIGYDLSAMQLTIAPADCANM